ncbi:MAG TPA: carboxypeptidase regulatory-like domain-containing protein, partial [Bryobacteraceae bacterium]|nr:carboxypeptidase regulatory-like domain-containing protein [Bryobacteraceae bacterium]
DDFTKILGAHTLKAGTQITRARKNENTNVRDEGTVTFNASARNTTRNVVADVLLGNFQSYVEPEADSFWWARSSQYEFYVQDTWRASRRLTVEIGVRYNIIPSFTNAQGNASTFLPRLFNRANAPQVDPSTGALLPGGDPYNGIAIFGSAFPDAARGRIPEYDDPAVQRLFLGLPATGSKTNYNDWGPRLGIAYDVFGNGKTAIRSGFGIFYDRVGSNQLRGQAQNPPFIKTANIFDGNIDNPAGGTARGFPTDVQAWPEILPTPKVVTYNFGVQQELPAAIILDVSYVGNIARHFVFTRDLNQLPEGTRLNAPNSSINVNALRPFPGYGAINLRDASDNSNYNSLQVAVNRRMSQRLAFGLSYTFSKTMDTVGGATPQDSYAPKNDIALSSIHRAHILSVNYIYMLPFFLQNGNPLLRHVLGGWEISGVTSAQSGAPVSVTVPVDIARIGASSSRASVIGDPNLSADKRTPERWFNTEAFLPPERMTPGRFGNAGRNILIGPGFQQWDVSLLKNFRFRERLGLQFRAESFNLFNHTNFTGINTTVRLDNAGRPTAGYGAVNASGPGRVLSFGLKLLF